MRLHRKTCLSPTPDGYTFQNGNSTRGIDELWMPGGLEIITPERCVASAQDVYPRGSIYHPGGSSPLESSHCILD
jgi:hypothetical protein